MNAIRFRHATVSLLLSMCLPAIAQDVRYESRGEAYIAGLEREDVEAAISRQVAAAAPADKAQVVFFRPTRLIDADVEFGVRESGIELARLPRGSYFVVAVPPGTYTYTTDADGSPLTLTVKPGKTYFAKAATPRNERDHPRLLRSTATAFIDAANGRRRAFR